jgi:hypothetical protein
LAALGLQDEGTRLAVEVDRRDGVDLRLRIGLNSGHVVAGEIGSGALGYTASRFRRQSSGHLAYHMPKQPFGDNLPRVAAVKDKYDPTNFFRVNHNIRPELAQAGGV